MEKRKYEEIRSYVDSEVQDALHRGDVDELSKVVIGVSLHHPDVGAGIALCKRLSGHKDPNVRGNAILGFGHLARRFGSLEESSIRPIIESGLVDQSAYVRGQSWAAAEDVVHFLNWSVKDFRPS